MNIILIGMPGVGKSTIGVVLAKTLGFKFLDTDLLIQENEKTLLQKIIDQKGMDYFLKVEQAAVCSITGDAMVIATGGSVVYKPLAMDHLKELGCIIYLNQPLKVIERRVRNIKTRGIAMGPHKTLKAVYKARKGLYEHYMDVTIKCRGKSVEGIVQEIMANFNGFEQKNEKRLKSNKNTQK